MDSVKSSPTVLYFISLNTENPFEQMDCVRFCKHCNCLAGLLLTLRNAICKSTHRRHSAHSTTLYAPEQVLPQAFCTVLSIRSRIKQQLLPASQTAASDLLLLHGSLRNEAKHVFCSLPSIFTKKRGPEGHPSANVL